MREMEVWHQAQAERDQRQARRFARAERVASQADAEQPEELQAAVRVAVSWQLLRLSNGLLYRPATGFTFGPPMGHAMWTKMGRKSRLPS